MDLVSLDISTDMLKLEMENLARELETESYTMTPMCSRKQCGKMCAKKCAKPKEAGIESSNITATFNDKFNAFDLD